jgi:hypothetical protein
MNLEKYRLKANKAYMSFMFTSVVPKGSIEKRIIYSKADERGVYNLAFGDNIKGSNEIDDTVVTNNKDGEKVLATVAASVYVFTEKYPKAWVVLTGSTKTRTRLYRMGISLYFDELIQDFIIYGYLNEEWVNFEKNTDYEAFIVKRKNKNHD